MLDFVTQQTKKAERSDQIFNTLKALRDGYDGFVKQQRVAENKLYSVLEGCLDFYYFLQTSDAHSLAFKNMCDFKFKADTKLVLLIAKAVFGKDNKQHYAYAKALENAVELEIGKDDSKTMAEWLRQNGGVNGVIRLTQTSPAADIVEDFGEYVITTRQGYENINKDIREHYSFTNKHLCKAVDSEQRYDCFLYVTVDRSGDQVKIQNFVIGEECVKKMYKLLQKEVGNTYIKNSKLFGEYKKLRQKQAKEAAERTDEVAEHLKKIANALA